ncbi:MAG TPA: hypothetical protein DCE41_18935 [Cytophagales bacterium]|nr:hypothetical protein [Cytophagales bacterium]HAA22114.1 hypothetical protein [Cytophagales bacterium]HAP60830.1 hypothetical protein [Cytophagales bacterium]
MASLDISSWKMSSCAKRLLRLSR